MPACPTDFRFPSQHTTELGGIFWHERRHMASNVVSGPRLLVLDHGEAQSQSHSQNVMPYEQGSGYGRYLRVRKSKVNARNTQIQTHAMVCAFISPKSSSSSLLLYDTNNMRTTSNCSLLHARNTSHRIGVPFEIGMYTLASG